MVPGRLALLACSMAACGLFPDLGAFQGGPGADGGGDGASDASPDVSTVTDAASSDAPLADAGPPSPCASQHDFCDDFDQGTLGATWDQSFTEVGPLSLSNVAVTPPNSLWATAQQGTTSGGATMLLKDFAGANHVHMELDVRVTNPADTTNSEVDFATLQVTPAPGYGFAVLTLFRWKTASVLEYYCEPSDGGAGKSVDSNLTEDFTTWRHVALDADFVNQTFSLTLDGTPAGQLTISPALPVGAFSAQAGVTYASGLKGDWQVLVDDVTVDRQ